MAEPPDMCHRVSGSLILGGFRIYHRDEDVSLNRDRVTHLVPSSLMAMTMITVTTQIKTGKGNCIDVFVEGTRELMTDIREIKLKTMSNHFTPIG